MTENVYIGIKVLYLFCAVFFVFISHKCFFEKRSIPKLLVLFFISPVTASFGGFIYYAASLNSLSWANTPEMIKEAVFQTLVQIVMQLILMAIYILLLKPKNKSIAIYVYLSASTLIPGMNFLLVSYSVIPIVLYFILHFLFYNLNISRIAELSKNKQVTDSKLFIILPSMAIVFNAVMYSVFNFLMHVIDSGELMDAVNEFKTLTGKNFSDGFKIGRLLVRYIKDSYAVFLYPSIFVALVLIIAFSVITKNIKYLNEAIEAKDEIKELSVEVMEALAHTIDAKDEYTKGHSIRVAKYSRMIAERMNLSPEQCENIYYMGLLHDIGKIGVPNEIINKTSRLTDDEYEVIKTHPVIGYDILSEIKSRPDLSTGARWHHERYDGKGYPDCKAGEEIPLEARIITVADCYDAMTSNRSYRKFLPQEKVRQELLNNIGTQFDEKAARCMIEIIDEDKEYKLHE